MLREIKQFTSKAEFFKVKEVLKKACRNNELRNSREGKSDFDDKSRKESSYEFYEDRVGNTWLLVPPEKNHHGSLRLYSSGNEPIPYRKKPRPYYEKKAELDVMFMVVFLAIGTPIAILVLLFKWSSGAF